MNAKQRLLTSLAATILILAAVSPVLRLGHRRYCDGRIEALTELARGSTPYDLVFVGSSRVRGDIDPVVIDRAIGSNSFNIGADGANLYEMRMLFDAYLEHHPMPETVVIGLDASSVDLTRKLFSPLLYFNFDDSAPIHQALVDSGSASRFVLWMPFLFFSLADDFTRATAIRGLFGAKELKPGESVRKGYYAPLPTMPYHDTPPHVPSRAIDPDESKAILRAMIERVADAGKRLVFVRTPELDGPHSSGGTGDSGDSGDSGSATAVVEGLARQFNIPYLRYEKSPLSKVREYFVDPVHLGLAGGEAFSGALAVDLAALIKGRGRTK